MTPAEFAIAYDLARDAASLAIIPLALMPAIIGAVGSMAGAGISAMGAAKQGRDAKKMAREQMAYQSPAAIRDRALAGGFNPLTVLTNGGLQQQMPTPLPTLSSLDAIGRGIGGAAQALASYDPIEVETRELENELLRTQIDTAKANAGHIGGFVQAPMEIGQWAMPSVQSITRSPVEKGAPKLSMAAPTPAPAPRDDWTFPIRTVDGAIKYIPPSYARRLGLERYDTLMAGELAEIMGELAGEGAGLAASPVVADLMSGNTNVRGQERPRASAGYGVVLDAARYNPLTASTMWFLDYMGSGEGELEFPETPSGKTNRKQ